MKVAVASIITHRGHRRKEWCERKMVIVLCETASMFAQNVNIAAATTVTPKFVSAFLKTRCGVGNSRLVAALVELYMVVVAISDSAVPEGFTPPRNGY